MDMDPHAKLQPQRPEEWRAERPEQKLRRRRLVQRGLVATLLFVLLGLFYWLLAIPFSRPTTTWTAGHLDCSPTTPSALPLAGRDVHQLQAVIQQSTDDPAPADGTSLLTWKDDAALASWPVLLQPLASTRTDVAIVYLSGQCAVIDQRAVVLDAAFRPSRPETIRLDLSDLLDELCAAPHDTKLLLLDAGQIGAHTQAGMARNQFPSELQRLVNATGDANLWVLVSHDSGEQSFVSPVLQQSVFTHFLTRALAGDADTDQDRVVDIRELGSFVQQHVEHHVFQVSRGQCTQRPQLLCGDADRQASPPFLPLIYLAEHRLTSLPATSSTKSTSDLDWQAIAKQMPQNTVEATAPAPAPSPAPEVPGSSPENSAAVPSSGSTSAATDQKARELEDRRTMARTLLQAWKLCDTAAQSPLAPAVADRPHTWSVLRQQLMGWEQRLRLHTDEPWRAISWDLQTQLAALSHTLDNTARGDNPTSSTGSPSTPQQATKLQGGSDVSVRANPNSPGPSAASSAAGSESPQPITAEQARADIEQRITSGSSSGLRQWLLENWQPAFASDATLDWAHRLASLPLIDDRLLLQSLELRQISDQLTLCRHDMSAWNPGEYWWAEQQRVFGEQCLLYGMQPSARVVAQQAFNRARSTYQQVAELEAMLTEASALWATIAARAPDYVRWFVNSGNQRAVWSPRFDDLDALLLEAAQLADLLDQPTEDHLAILRQSTTHLSARRDMLERPLSPAAVDQLIEPRKVASHLWEIQSLLATSLPDSKTRVTLLGAAQQGRSRFLALPPAEPKSNHVATPTLLRPWQCVQLQARLLALGITPSSPLRQKSDKHLAAITSVTDKWFSHSGGSLRAHESVPDPHELQTAESRQRDLYQNAVTRLEHLADNQHVTDYGVARQMHCELRRLLYILDPRDAQLFADTSLELLRTRLTTYQMHRQRLQRAWAGGADFAEAERPVWEAACEAERQRASAIFSTPELALPPIQAPTWQGPSRVPLLYTARQKIALQLDNIHHDPGPMWLVVDYDPQKIDLQWHSPLTVYPWDALSWSLAARQDEPLQQQTPTSQTLLVRTWHDAATQLEPSVVDARATSVRLPLTITRREGQGGTTQIVVRALSQTRLSRHDIRVELPGEPPVRMVVHGQPSCVTDQPQRINLHPWPNRTTSYTFAIANRQPNARQVKVVIHALPADLSGQIAAARLEQVNNQNFSGDGNDIEESQRENKPIDLGTILGSFDRLQIPANAELPVPWNVFKSKLPAGTEPTPGAATATAATEPLKLAGDLLCVIQDVNTNETWYQVISIAPQRPRNYVVPTVKYDSQRGIVDVHVRAHDIGLLPAEGIPIQAHFGHQTTSSSKVLPQVVLRAPAGEVRMQASLATAPRPQHLYLDVDNYPRAFVFELTTNPASDVVPPAPDYLAIRITSPQQHALFATATEYLPVELQVDVPPGALNAPSNEITVALDTQQDRDLTNDPVAVLHSDRHVQNWLLVTEPNGRIVCHSSVTDQRAMLLATGARNARATIRADVTVGQQRLQASPVDIVLDTEPPQVLDVHVEQPQMIARGHVARVTVRATDRQLSGIARVEAAWDPQSTGEFPAAGAAAVAHHEPGVGWHLELVAKDLPLGKQTLLVRAVDQADHISKPVATEVTIVDPALLDAVPVTVRGTVTLQGQPVGGAKVSITDADGKTTKPVATAADGSFALPGIVPGEKSIHAVVYVRNLPREVTKRLIVAPIYEVAKPITVAIP